MQRVRWRLVAWAWAAAIVGSPCPVGAGHVVFDVADRHVLEAADADAVVAPGRVADLLLVAVLRERLAAREMALPDRLTVLPVVGDRGPRLATHEQIEIGELLQLLLLTDSRTAAKTLAWAAGPGIGRCLVRMQQVSNRLGLTHTTVADDWPFAGVLGPAAASGRRGSTSARDLGRLAILVTSDPELRRRLALDGVPISNGGLIARATAPLIAMRAERAPVPRDAPSGGAQIAFAERDGLELLAVATGPRAGDELAAAFDQAFQRYHRVELVHEGQAVGPTVYVRGGIIPTFNAVAGEAWALTTPQSSRPDLAFRLQLPTEINAPVEVHQSVGELVVEQRGRLLAVVPLVAPQAIAPSGWLDTAHRSEPRR